MAIVRIAINEVQVDDLIYSFDAPDQADAFEACVATVDLAYCTRQHPPVAQRDAGPISQAGPSDEIKPVQDDGA